MRNRSLSFSLIVSSVFVALMGCGPEPESDDPDSDQIEGDQKSLVTYADITWWRGLSQAARNQLILERAYRDLGVNVGKNCKEWVQLSVVPGASRGVASVPATYPNPDGWTWYWGPYATVQYTNIRQAQPGWIVQMEIPLKAGGRTPHTAIVFGRSATGIYWLDSNWRGDTTVRLHFQTFAEFESWTLVNGTYRYSVYSISGGY